MPPKDPSKVVNFRVSISSDKGELQAGGQAALVPDLPWKDSFISVGFAYRNVMTTRDCFQSADGDPRYGGAGLCGWVDLIGAGWKPKLSATKDDIDDAQLRERLMHQIFLKIEPLLKQTEQDRLAIVLDGLALDLTDALNGINDLDIELGEGNHGAASAGMLRDDRLTFDDVVRPFKPIMPKVVDPSRKGPYPYGNQKPPATRLKLHPVSDKEIDGALCRMDLISEHENNLLIEINKEHEVVEELLKPRQLNKMALNMMITREIASALIRHPQTMRRILARRVQAKLDTFPDDASRERLLARLLMDSARRPKLDDEVAA